MMLSGEHAPIARWQEQMRQLLPLNSANARAFKLTTGLGRVPSQAHPVASSGESPAPAASA